MLQKNPQANPLSDDRPHTLVVGAVRYRIEYVYDLHDSEGKAVEASLHASEALIEIEARLDPQERYVTIWHEALHLVLRQVGLPGGVVSESILELMSYGILGVLSRNTYLRRIPNAAACE